MKILIILTYYRPHVSGLTIYAERLARALADRGHRITVLTSHYAKDLAYEERTDGVRVVRVPVAFRFNKGAFMPTFPLAAWREIRAHDVVNIHLPQVEAALGVLLARLAGHKPILTYHCDLRMPPVWYGRVVDRITFWNNVAAGKLADTIVTNTEDFARHSPVLARFGLAICGPPGQGACHHSADRDRRPCAGWATSLPRRNSAWPRGSPWSASWAGSRTRRGWTT